MRIFLYVLLAVAVMLITAVAMIPFFISTEAVQSHLVAQLRQQTGRDIVIGGETSLAFFPKLAVTTTDIAISNPPDMAQGTLIKAQDMTVALKLVPLLQGQVEVDRFVLHEPDIVLLVDKKGRKNWVFERANENQAKSGAAGAKIITTADGTINQTVQTERVGPKFLFATAGGGASPAGERVGGYVRNLRLGDVRLVNGTVTYLDERKGVRQMLKPVNLTVTLPDLSAPLVLKGDVGWAGETVDVVSRIESLQALNAGKPSPFATSLASRRVKADFKGALLIEPELAMSGGLNANMPSARAFAAWLGAKLPTGKGFGPFKLIAQTKATPAQLHFTKAKMTLDGMTSTGNILVKLDGPKPYIKSALVADTLDLNLYLAEGGAKPTRKQGAKPAPRAIKYATMPGGDPLGKFIDKLGGQSDTSTAAQSGSGWSQTEMKLSGLNSVNADIALSVSKILFKKMTFGKSALNAKLRGGILDTTLKKLTLYGGQGKGKVRVDGRKSVPRLSTDLVFSGVSARPFLKDATDFDRVSGKMQATFKLATRGRSQAEQTKALNGSGAVTFTDGAIEGVNIPQMMRSLTSGALLGWQNNGGGGSQKTDFSELKGTFTVKNGVAQNKDLNMLAPLVRLKGAGIVDIPRKQLDYRVQPKLVASLKGQGGAGGLKGLEIPVRIVGPWSKPRFEPDLSAALKNPEKVVEGVKELGKQLKGLKNGKNAEEVLKNLLGGNKRQNKSGQAGQSNTGSKAKPEELLKNLFQ